MKTTKNLTVAVLVLASLSACQKKSNSSEPAPAPAAAPAPTVAPATTYNFTPQQDQLTGVYTFTSVTNGSRCTTGSLSYNSRTELCNLLKDEAKNNNCAVAERQNAFAQQCQLNSAAVVPGSVMPIPAQNSVPVANLPNGAKLLVCQINKQGNSDNRFLGINWESHSTSSKVISMPWIEQNGPKSISKVIDQGTISVNLTPAMAGISAQIKVSVSKQSDERNKKASKLLSVQSALDQGVTLRVLDEEDQQETVVSCSVQGSVPVPVVGTKVICEGSGKTAEGRKIKIDRSYPLNSQAGIIDTIELNKDDSQVLNLQAGVAVGNSAGRIAFDLPSQGQDMSMTATLPLTNSNTIVQQTERTTGFSLDLKCRVAQ